MEHIRGSSLPDSHVNLYLLMDTNERRSKHKTEPSGVGGDLQTT